MIGRLVQNQNIRFNEQQPHQREPCALSAGKRRDPLVLLRLGKAEARQHGADSGFVLISADFPEFLRQRGKFRDCFFIALVMDCTCHGFDFGMKGIQPRFDPAAFGKGVRHFLEQRFIAFEHGVLFEHRDRFALGDINGAGGGLRLARDDAKQRGFSGSVDTHHAESVPFVQGKIYFLQNDIRAVFDENIMSAHDRHFLVNPFP